MGLKKQKSRSKITKEVVAKRGSECEQYPAFSFRFLTKNKKFNYEYFSEGKDKEKMLSHLSQKIIELTQNPYTHWNNLAKQTGIEMLYYWQMDHVIPSGLEMTKDDKVWVFRFCSQDYRILGVRLESCPTMYIIGFDFNYKAYSH